ncbi:serine/threonine protein kinase [Reticulomyxa filosa]|uniref:Serine/threonine protein kinase n=1 Tax=Reticulomyxa filosa TaxID=46433 RepID=X6NR07_RETFI|nr:serine/threonine protein kinase [Reticulomyxa filosa]|eukprot:ETO28421.1 serine/threonine protein kinase [Reticulomyxa filosa]
MLKKYNPFNLNYKKNLKKLYLGLIMLILDEEECQAVKVKSLKALLFEGCYDKDWMAASNKQSLLKSLQCLLCNQIASNAMELTCNEHEDHKDTLLVGEQCLMKYLHKHNNQCPIGKHGLCSYVKGRAVRRIVSELKITCPRQFINHFNQNANNRTKEGNIITEVEHVCKFKGNPEEMKEHLENTCPLKPLGCKFKEFGCHDILSDFNFEQHLQLQMKKHLDLLLEYVATLQNKMKQIQFNEFNPVIVYFFFKKKYTNALEEIKQLKLKIKEQENEIQLLKANNDNNSLQWDEKEKEMKKLQNHLQQESLKYREDFESSKLKIDESNRKLNKNNTKINQLKKKIQNKDNEINALHQDIQLKDKQIIDKEKLIQQMKRDFNDKERQSQSHYEQSIKLLKDKHLQLIQDFHKLSKKEIPTIHFDKFRSSYKLINTLTGHTSIVWNIDYSTFDDCQFICSGSLDKTVCVWDIDNNRQIQSFNRHLYHVYCAKFSQYHHYNTNRNVICSSSYDKTIRFWDFKNNQQLQVLNGHTSGVWGVIFSTFSGGRYLCSGSFDWTIRLWDVETSKSLLCFNGHTGTVRCMDISPLQNSNNNKSNNIGVIGGNGYTICSGSRDNTIRIWDIETAKQLIVFKGHKHWVTSVKYGSNELLKQYYLDQLIKAFVCGIFELNNKFKFSKDIQIMCGLLNIHHL